MQIVKTTADLATACTDLANSDFVAVDTEFMREQTFWPHLCLIQLAGPEHEFIVDPLADSIDLSPFWQLMGDTNTVKVFHAARQDIEIVFFEGKLIPTPVFDTQVAAMVCGFGDSISYVNLVKRITGRSLDKSSRFTDWSRRPLSDKQLHYALGDVTHLRDAYEHLSGELEATNRTSWLAEEMRALTDPDTYRLRPEHAWKRLKLRVKGRKNLAVLIELAAWRERLAQSQDVPRNRILRDEVLYDIANQAPTDPAELSQLRSISQGFSKSARAREIVEAVKTGLARDIKDVPAIKHGKPLSAEATATLELLKVLLKAAAARHRVAPRLIADASDLERIAADDKPETRSLQGWRKKLFGEDALRLKRGELALTLSNGDVRIIETTPARQEV